MPPEIIYEKCVACGNCVDICPEDVFFGTKGFGKVKGEQPVVTYPEMCWHDNMCVEACPVEGAIKLRIPLAMHLVHK